VAAKFRFTTCFGGMLAAGELFCAMDCVCGQAQSQAQKKALEQGLWRLNVGCKFPLFESGEDQWQRSLPVPLNEILNPPDIAIKDNGLRALCQIAQELKKLSCKCE
jgi:hypothetical protein